MHQFPSTEAKDNWGMIADTALREPVGITKHGRPTLVVTSVQDYEALLRLKEAHLKADIQLAAGQVARGEAIEIEGEEQLKTFFDEIKRKGRDTSRQPGQSGS